MLIKHFMSIIQLSRGVPGRHYSLEEAVINRVRSARYNWQAGGCLEGSTFVKSTKHFPR